MSHIGCSSSDSRAKGVIAAQAMKSHRLCRATPSRYARSVSGGAYVRSVMLSMVVAFVGVTSAQAQANDESLQIYAAKVGEGYGIYVANGLVITPAHNVATGVRPMVLVGGLNIAAKVIKAGAKEDVDLALLMTEPQQLPMSVRMRRIEFCEKLLPGEPVVIVAPERTDRSTIVSPSVLPAELRTKFPTLIRGGASIADYGSGVFRVGRKCLLGIVTRSLQASSKDGETGPSDVVQYFVPANTVLSFIPNWFRGWSASRFGK